MHNMDTEEIVNKRCKGRAGVPSNQTQVDILMRIMWCLLQPDGCPWDRKQTHQSLSRHMIEEAFEAADAMDSGDIANLQEELGDVLLQVALHSAIAERDGEFSFEDVARTLNEKLIRRHPHIFGDLNAESEDDVLNIWQSVKDKEKEQRKEDIFTGIPIALPALLQAQLLQDRAKEKLHIDTNPNSTSSLKDDIASLETDKLSQEDAKKLLGDAFFLLVSIARNYNIDAEGALRDACQSYKRIIQNEHSSQ